VQQRCALMSWPHKAPRVQPRARACAVRYGGDTHPTLIQRGSRRHRESQRHGDTMARGLTNIVSWIRWPRVPMELRLGPRDGCWQGGASHGCFEVTIGLAWIEQWLTTMTFVHSTRAHMEVASRVLRLSMGVVAPMIGARARAVLGARCSPRPSIGPS
jgi:hypothetical protein